VHRSMKRTADNVSPLFSLQHMLAAVLIRVAAMCYCRFRRWLSVIAFLLFVVSPVTAFAECGPTTQDDAGAQPRVGLALSGGGARGAAHIGVIRVVLEEGVAIDCIAGTSMGAIVGGLYASGMTLEEIEQALNDIDWDDVFIDSTNRADKTFRRKRDDDDFLIKKRVGFSGGKIKLPLGVVQGQKIDLAITKLTLPVAFVDDFDELPIPYRAVATYIATGEQIVLGSGDLATAILASFSIPAAMVPVLIDGRMLVDGGIAANLPISVVREMGADIVIAVDISTPLKSQDEISSVLSIAEQLSGFLTRRNTESELATLTESDILIRPNLGDISAGDFDRVNEAIPIGRAAALENLDRLREISLSSPGDQEILVAKMKPGTSKPLIEFIRWNNQSRLSNEYIVSRVDEFELGQPLDTEKLESSIARIYGIEAFQKVSFRIIEDGSQTGLEVTAVERSWGPKYLQFGLNIASVAGGENLINASISHLNTAMNPSGGEWRNTITLGNETSFSSAFHQPFGRDYRYFVAPKLSIGSTDFNVYESGNAIGTLSVFSAIGELAVGREFGNWGGLQVGARYLTGERDVRVGEPKPHESFDLGEAFLDFAIDRLDNRNFPRHGTFGAVRWIGARESLGSDVGFDQLSAGFSAANSWGRNTLLAGIRYGTTFSGRAPRERLYRLGGFFNLSGLNPDELTGQHLGIANLAYYRRVGDIALLPTYIGATVELGNTWQDRSDISLDNSIFAGSAFIGVDTFIGPVYTAFGLAEGGQRALYFYVGRTF
jgi:NTE family protein